MINVEVPRQPLAFSPKARGRSHPPTAAQPPASWVSNLSAPTLLRTTQLTTDVTSIYPRGTSMFDNLSYAPHIRGGQPP